MDIIQYLLSVIQYLYRQNSIFTVDKTCIKLRSIKAYVCLIMNASTRSILGYQVSDHCMDYHPLHKQQQDKSLAPSLNYGGSLSRNRGEFPPLIYAALQTQ